MISKQARQQAILRVVRERDVATQTGLVDELGSRGIEVNQSTVSRDIKDLGLIKTPRTDGGYKYSLPTNVVALTERSLRILREFINAVDGSGQIAAIHTDSGNAHAVAEALDRMNLDDVVGTVAGDNTLMVLLRESVDWRQFRNKLEELL